MGQRFYAPFARLGHVRFGSKADICSAQAHVRFTPIRLRGSPLWAINGHLEPAKQYRVLDFEVVFGSCRKQLW